MGSTSASGTGSAAPTAASAISRGRTPLLAAALVLLGAASPAAPLELDFDGVRSTKGLIRVCLTADPKNFPNCVDDARALTRNIPAGTRDLRLSGLAPGSYAVAVIHDENGNSRLDTLAGIPREGFGFSNNPAIAFGPPRFVAARFALVAGGTRQEIRMRYIF